MKGIWIDFIAPISPQIRLVRLALLIAGLIFFSLSFVNQRMVSDQLEALKWQYQSLNKSYSFKAMPKMKDSKSLDEDRHANEILMSLNRPWDKFFNALEKSVGSQIGILSVAPDSEKSTVVIKAVAPNINIAVDFIARMQATGLFSDVNLLQQEMLADSPRMPLMFTLSARWIIAP